LSKKEIKHSREGPLKHDQTKGGDRPLPPSKNVDLSVNTAAAHQGQHAGTRKAEKKQAEGLFFFFFFFFFGCVFEPREVTQTVSRKQVLGNRPKITHTKNQAPPMLIYKFPQALLKNQKKNFFFQKFFSSACSEVT
jgi:hypothetical protein